MEHTPIPWTTVGQAGQIMDVVVVGPKSQGVCEMTGHVGQDRDADAAFIVRAVNNHAKLLKALEECYRVLAGGSYHAAPATAQARAAIEEARK